jgi:predicted HTH domain antitoxin
VEEMRRLIAFELFAQRRLSSGKAAQLANMPRVVFLFEAGKRGIEWLPYDSEELSKELQE